MIVDDEKEIHQVTRMVLGDYHYQNRNALLLDAYSAKQALQLIREHPDTALIIPGFRPPSVPCKQFLIHLIQEPFFSVFSVDLPDHKRAYRRL